MEPTPPPSPETGRLAGAGGSLLLVHLVLSAADLYMAFNLSKFRSVFEDMLGPDQPLPALTAALTGYPVFLQCLSLAIAVVGVLCARGLPPAKAVPAVRAAIVAAFLFATLLLAGLFLPMVTIMNAVSAP